MILSAVIPRWWNVTPTQLHWVGLNMAYAESSLAQSALNEAERRRVVAVLDHYIPPSRLKKIERLLAEGEVRRAEDNIVPSEMYLVARELAPGDHDSALADDLRRIAAEAPEEVERRSAISHAFGTPKPLLSTSYEPALLNLRTFPTLMGYSSRILAESWESNLLFYAALADEVHMRPAELNLRVPEWTQQTVEHIFATHLEDWPALLRSLRLVGDDVLPEGAQTSGCTKSKSRIAIDLGELESGRIENCFVEWVSSSCWWCWRWRRTVPRFASKWTWWCSRSPSPITRATTSTACNPRIFAS